MYCGTVTIRFEAETEEEAEALNDKIQMAVATHVQEIAYDIDSDVWEKE